MTVELRYAFNFSKDKFVAGCKTTWRLHADGKIAH